MRHRNYILIPLLMVLLVAAGCTSTAPLPTPTAVDIDALVEAKTEKTIAVYDDRIESLEKTIAALAEAKTPTPELTEKATEAPAASGGTDMSGCLKAEFVADITIPDETTLPPGSPFKKTWAIKNVGTCPWDTTYRLSYLMGDQMGADSSYPLPDDYVAPGDMVLVSVNMVAPEVNDRYESYWKIENSWGTRFGVEPEGAPLTAIINVAPYYSFIENICSATWHNGHQNLYCPGAKDDDDGSFYVVDSYQVEGGKVENQPAILLAPEQVQEGEIYAKFQPIKIPGGAHLITHIGCIYGMEYCNFDFVVTYTVSGGQETIIEEYNDWYDGFGTDIDYDLGDLGLDSKIVSFAFYVKAHGGPEDLVYMWNPRLEVK